jgi:hypothetical protein
LALGPNQHPITSVPRFSAENRPGFELTTQL